VSTTALSVADLRPIDLFDDLDDSELERWAAVTHIQGYKAGDIVAEQGQRQPSMFLVLEGTLQALLVNDGRVEPAGQHNAPTWIGAIGVLIEMPISLRIQAATDARIGMVPAAAALDLILEQSAVRKRVLQQVRPVLGRIEAVEQNRERLAALGTMAAGLAHELNNPAAAAKRAAADMCETVDILTNTISRFVHSGVQRDEAEKLAEMQQAALKHAKDSPALDTIDAADAEDELTDVLEDLEVPEAWRLTEPLVRGGVDRAWVEQVHELAGPATPAALEWVAASLTARGLAAELSDSAERMSRLVGAVKSYAYMDRGEIVETDIHEGLDTTIVVLGHKLKHTKIGIARDYDRTLPQVLANGSELNQVWTNLIDNAIDALGEDGTITVKTRLENECAVIEISDDGPGIPEDVRSRIFEPFFTTKSVGQGTGLGLDTVRRIVEQRHHGTIAVDSRPGETTFRVWLPLKQTA
jgi:signal transduction histidine kinase